ncbi:hypothetical protein Glove_132g106 [Diversispora epigaea]|uniref:Uncharacterized protein n=1 Tax=Diversispora epigaea TaxID=1348612 RepID=A0A397J6S4_9GLOM|nr:hypothetical protein Glove_132g106 [Diversispora epigaea]
MKLVSKKNNNNNYLFIDGQYIKTKEQQKVIRRNDTEQDLKCKTSKSSRTIRTKILTLYISKSFYRLMTLFGESPSTKNFSLTRVRGGAMDLFTFVETSITLLIINSNIFLMLYYKCERSRLKGRINLEISCPPAPRHPS